MRQTHAPLRTGLSFRGMGNALLCLALMLATLCVWRWANLGLPAAEAPPPVAGLAYNAFQRWQSPLEGQWPRTDDIAADLAALSPITSRLRAYSASELPALPQLARQHGLRLTAGVWLDTQASRNEQELQAIEAAVTAERQQFGGATAAVHSVDGLATRVEGRSIERVIAGNETQLHQLVPLEELLAILKRLRSSLDVPVSTAEPWHVWLAHPELVEQVDFIAAHLLPYWEGVPVEVAVHEVWRRYDELRLRYPGKPVVIAEVGWPSAGPRVEKRVDGALNQASASPLSQARFMREFVASARLRGSNTDYFLMEAIDQPWKVATEGQVGAHWGVLDARRVAKFDWTGPAERDPYWRGKAAAAALLGILVLWPFLMRTPNMGRAGRLAFGIAAQAVASLVVVLATWPLADYLRVLDAVLLALLVPALLLMAAILLTQAFEFAELFWEGSLQRRAGARPVAAGDPTPMVSVHLACCNEPAPMVLAAIRSLQALDWPYLEILIIDNNSDDPGCWMPVQAYVEQQRALGDLRVRFIRLPRWPGYKAGALNEGLRQTDSAAAWVAVVDADYVVDPQWLRRLGGWFSEPDVAVVQSPQAHRAWSRTRMARMMNWEYEGFFRLGMHHRHERTAIVQHGTMTLIRAQALKDVGGWNTECVCEDTELGLRLLEAGWQKVYVDEVLGTGLVPSGFEAYQRQRERWARGGMQILRGHARALFGASGLSLGQRYHFLAGWLPWIGDTLHLVFTITALLWSAAVLLAPTEFSLPHPLLALPLLVFFTARLVMTPLLYHRRVPCSLQDVIGAAWAGMSLSHRIARGVVAGLFGGTAAFQVTAKAAEGDGDGDALPVGAGAGPERNAGLGAPARSAARPAPQWSHWRVWPLWRSVREEGALLLAILIVASGLALTVDGVSLGLWAWWAILGLQALPYLAALSCAGLSRPRAQGGLNTV